MIDISGNSEVLPVVGPEAESEFQHAVDCRTAHRKVVQELLAARTEAGHWEGRLSTSALSTATAVSALSLYHKNQVAGPFDERQIVGLIQGGVEYLLGAQNADGGWGDTDKSYSNIATTYLGWAALKLAQSTEVPLNTVRCEVAVQRARAMIRQWGGIAALRQRYGKDKTFVVPILTNAALAGLVDWKEVNALPFEAAWVPQRFYRFLRLPVVSYAVPALVAIGQAKYFHDPPNLLIRWFRRWAVQPTMNVLRRMQPASGGYLEAAPLTSFVAMSLAATGRANHDVTIHAIRFLLENVLEDGSWPIDTNLATWVTSLSVNALATCPPALEAEKQSIPDATTIMPASGWQWLLDCQYEEPHPFTGADPGGWGWTNLTGSVPDADDTPGALLALFVALQLQRQNAARFDQGSLKRRAARGIVWLLDLQNSDGGWPTFCRGWGKLPFDRSGVDLTAHAIRAFEVWFPEMEADLRIRMDKALLRGWRYIRRQQEDRGGWQPLWFGNQDLPDDENPVYGTAKTLLGLLALRRHFTTRKMPHPARIVSLVEELEDCLESGIEFLGGLQNPDHGWGGGPSVRAFWEAKGQNPPLFESSVEESALAIEALASWLTTTPRATESALADDIRRKTGAGVDFLCQRILRDEHRNSWPIGFYFAKLWYHEELYPLVFCVAALGHWSHAAAVRPARSPGG